MQNVLPRQFLNQDFLLETETARQLYEHYAAPMPIIDYHNHLSPKDIAEDKQYQNLTEVWLEGDHYKWRAMRINGIDEVYITGSASPEEKFKKWAQTVPYTMRNPLYHWTHLELKNYFGIEDQLDETTASEIYKSCAAMLATKNFSAVSLLKRMNVEVVCTTDDPIDTLVYHQAFSKKSTGVRMFPTFRPDKAFAVDDPKKYLQYLEQLAAAAQTSINNFDDLLQALSYRADYFAQNGCKVSDHGLEYLHYDPAAESRAQAIFKKLKDGKALDDTEIRQFKCAVLVALGRMYHKKGWVQQFHVGAMRNNNSRLLRSVGADAGVDSIGDYPQAYALSRFLDHLDSTDQLAKTILYNNNPADNELFATMIGNFSDGTVAGKIQYGSGWWFLDQKDGMERQMNALSNMGLISRFVGMVTDSRSMLSFPRHEYFRRILCNLWGNDVEKGLLPDNVPFIGKMVSNICYHNAKTYFGL